MYSTVHVHVYTRASPTDILARKSARRTKVCGQVGELNGPRAEFGEEVGVGVRVGLVEFKLNYTALEVERARVCVCVCVNAGSRQITERLGRIQRRCHRYHSTYMSVII